ncbi:unnamed protein product (mitochondrion) [Plasmodiophora brassicae]|uniref:Ketoreductase domain-containing protein n=1 Tax=Plasmodiophora brassicae TaxID=37360 RepID=A0A0G4IP17_PLABS|nr:hypothetical protein PBRA_005642 [Plasmodiophora brassicae]SPR01019.1 unnamed protein product [Plasmodiophora brassicae]
MGADVVVVVGGGRGIGLATARVMGARGDAVVVVDCDAGSIERIRNEEQGIAKAICCDVTDADAWEACVLLIKKFVAPRHVSVVMHTAAVLNGKSVDDLTRADVRRSFDINVLSWYSVVRAFLPDMKRHRRGLVITMSSIVAYGAGADASDYCATKSAVLSMNDCLRLELTRDGYSDCVHTMVVHPYLTSTGLFEGARLNLAWLFPVQTPEDVAQAIVRGIRRRSPKIFIPRRLALVAAVQCMLPTFLQDVVYSISGALNFMENYTGRVSVDDKQK